MEWIAGAVGIGADAGPTSAQLRVQFIRENPELLQTFAANLLPQMLQVYNGSVVQQVCSLSPSLLLQVEGCLKGPPLSGALQRHACIVDAFHDRVSTVPYQRAGDCQETESAIDGECRCGTRRCR